MTLQTQHQLVANPSFRRWRDQRVGQNSGSDKEKQESFIESYTKAITTVEVNSSRVF